MGILGGTFNPPHVGHLSVARHAHARLSLDQVLLIPVHTPPHKPTGEEDPGPRHRLAMTALLAESEPWMEASDLEVQRGGPSYTVDTLTAIHVRHPGDELTLIVGADMARTLPQWRQPQQILRLARLAVAERDDTAQREIRQVLAPLIAAAGVGEDDRVTFLEMEPVDVSSSQIRELLAAGRGVDDLVPPAVAEYIAGHGLYRAGAGEAGSAREAGVASQ